MMKRTVLLIIFTSLVAILKAQDVKVESGSEEMDSTKFSKLVKSYQHIIMAEREELTLIKVDLLGPLLYVMSGIDSSKHNVLRLSFEKKFKPEWSWIVAAEGQANEHDFTELRFRGGARYYFNMEKRILKGKSANNFSANYISSRLNFKRKPLKDINTLSLDLVFGIQRRLWKYGYVDFDIGIENIITSFGTGQTVGVEFTSSIQVGIAF